MSDEAVELINAAYAAINRDDLEALLSLIHPDAEFQSLIAESEGRTYRGHEGTREWWEQVKGSLGGLHFEAEEVHGRGDCVVAKLLVSGHAGGVPVSQRMWHATRLRNRRAIWWGVYRTHADAFEAVGLSE